MFSRREMMTTRTALLVALCMFAAYPQIASAEKIERSPAKAEFAMRASDGFLARVTGTGKQVEMAFENKASAVIYKTKGLTSTRRFRARFGGLGRIDLQFRASGSKEHWEPPERCKGNPEVIQRGLFVGKIEFRGETGYVRINARRVRGRVTYPHSWRCKDSESGDSEFVESLPFSVPVFFASTPHSRTAFGVIGSNRSERDQTSIFAAGTLSRLGTMKVERAVFAEGERRHFQFKGDFSAATITSPSPFQGAGTFVRNPDGSTSWSGDLKVSLPGVGVVPLTGPEFAVDLSRPRTFGDFLDLFDVPTLP